MSAHEGRQVFFMLLIVLMSFQTATNDDEYSALNETSTEIIEVTVQEYPTLNFVPKTDFSCHEKYPGYYSDPHPDSRCQVFHYCYPDGTYSSFLCPNTTIFNQRYFVCDFYHNFDCSTATQFYKLNSIFLEDQNLEDEEYFY